MSSPLRYPGMLTSRAAIEPGYPAAGDRRGDVGDAAVEPGEAGGRLVLDRHRVGDVGNHQRLAAAERDLHGAVRVIDRLDVEVRRQLADDLVLLVAQRHRAGGVGVGDAVVERRQPVGERVDLVDGCADAAIGVELRLLEAAVGRADLTGQQLAPCQHVGARGARRRRLRERAEAVEELVQPRVQRRVGRSEARLDDAERFGERRLAVLRRILLEQPAIEEAVAEAAHAEHFDAVAGVQALARRRHRAEVDDAARVAGRVHVGDVLAGRVEAVALRVERARRGREHAEEARHQPLACRTPAASPLRNARSGRSGP